MSQAAYYTQVILPVKKYLQECDYDCGSATLKIVFNTLGRDSDYREIKEIAQTCEVGTTHANVIKTLHQCGIKYTEKRNASMQQLVDEVCGLNLCIVDYQAWGANGEDFANLNAGHFSIVFGFNTTHLFIADPGKYKTKKSKQWGVRKIRKDLFEQRWLDEDEGKIVKHWLVSVPLCQ